MIFFTTTKKYTLFIAWKWHIEIWRELNEHCFQSYNTKKFWNLLVISLGNQVEDHFLIWNEKKGIDIDKLTKLHRNCGIIDFTNFWSHWNTSIKGHSEFRWE